MSTTNEEGRYAVRGGAACSASRGYVNMSGDTTLTPEGARVMAKRLVAAAMDAEKYRAEVDHAEAAMIARLPKGRTAVADAETDKGWGGTSLGPAWVIQRRQPGGRWFPICACGSPRAALRQFDSGEPLEAAEARLVRVQDGRTVKVLAWVGEQA